jgi:hypothetical protein
MNISQQPVSSGTPTKPKQEPLPPLPNALVYSIRDVRRMGGPGKTSIYALAKAGKLKLVRIGSRTLVDGDSLRALLREGTGAALRQPPKPAIRAARKAAAHRAAAQAAA